MMSVETSELENIVTNMTYKMPLILKERSVKSENQKDRKNMKYLNTWEIWVCVDAEIDFYEKERLGVELWAVEEL